MAVANSEEAEYHISPKQVLAHVALCGLDREETCTQTNSKLKIFNRAPRGSPEYVHGRRRTLPIMLAHIMIGDTSAGAG